MQKDDIATPSGPGAPAGANSATPAEQAKVTLARRENALTLYREFRSAVLQTDLPVTGVEKAFAEHIQVSPSMWSMLKGQRPIGTKLARQIEAHCGKEPGWLDVERASDVPSAGEQQLMALVLQASRATNAAGRKSLKALLRAIAESGVVPEPPRGQ